MREGLACLFERAVEMQHAHFMRRMFCL